MSKYYYNKDYFQKIDSGEKAYWLGFLYADGCICRFYKGEKLKSMHLEISLCIDDKHHLEKFVSAIQSNIPIKEYVNKCNGKEYRSCKVTVCCTKMCYDLINLGCTPKKTFNIVFPSYDIVPEEFIKFWLEGFFDGDGCVHINKTNNKQRIEVTITGIQSMLNSIDSFLVNNKILTKSSKIYQDQRSSACSIYFYGNNAKRFLDYIYGDTTIYLDRKYKKYIDFYKDYSLINTHGVYWSKDNKAYVVTIYIDGKKVRVGQSKDLEQAVQMRQEAEIAKYLNSPLNQ